MSTSHSFPADIAIREMAEGDLDALVRTFARWHKDRSLFEGYLLEQQRDERVVFLALRGDRVVGYVTVVWQSPYDPFRQLGIPEIVDLNVMTEDQRQGIGTALIRAAEGAVAYRLVARVGISVVQSPEYAAANRLYPQLGFTPDGLGITARDGELHLIKTL